MGQRWDLAAVISVVDKVSGPLNKITKNFNRFERTVNNIGGAARGFVSSIRDIAAPAIALGGFMAGGMLKTAASFEDMTATLEVIQGSSEKARQSMSWISDFAAKTPYEMGEVTEAFVKLKAYGLDGMKDGLLNTLGDTSAAMGKPLMQTIEAIADAVTGENERLKEFGIKASKAKGGGPTTYSYKDKDGKQQTKTVDSNNREQIQSTLQAIWNEKFAGAMEKRSQTWTGVMSNMKDQYTRFSLMVMNSGAFDFMKTNLNNLLTEVNKLAADGTLQKWASEVGGDIQEFFSVLTGGKNKSPREVLEQMKDGLRAVIHGATKLAQIIVYIKDRVGGWDKLLVGLFLLTNAKLFTSLARLSLDVAKLGLSFVKMGLQAAEAYRATRLFQAAGGIGPVAPPTTGAGKIGAGLAKGVAALGPMLMAAFEPLLAFVLPVLEVIGAAIAGITAPVWLVIAAIAAVVAALVGLYVYWDEVSAFVKRALDEWPQWLGYACGYMLAKFEQFGAWVSGLWDSLSSTVTGWVDSAVSAVSNGVSNMIAWLSTLPAQALAFGQQILDFFVNLWNDPIGAINGFISSAIGKFSGWVDWVYAKVGAMLAWLSNAWASIKEGFSGGFGAGYAAGGGAPVGAPPVKFGAGNANVNVNFGNLPQGASVSTQSSGVNVKSNVGSRGGRANF